MLTYDQVCENHRDILDAMSNGRIFKITNYSGIAIEEACNNFYDYDLTRDDCLELAELFNDLAKVVDAQGVVICH